MNLPNLAPRIDGESQQPAAARLGLYRLRAGRIRVLHVINDLELGGSEIALCRLLSLTDRAAFDPAVIFLREPSTLRSRIEALGIPVLSAGMSKPVPGPASLWRLARLVRRVNPDLIQGWMYHGSLAAQFARRFSSRNAPVLWGIHNCLNSLSHEKSSTALVIRLCALLSHRAAGIVFVSYANRMQHESFGYAGKNSWVIPNGFEVRGAASRLKARSRLREDLGLGENTLLIGHVGRFHPSKDHVTFLQAAALLAPQHGDVQFVLCGNGVDGNNKALVGLCRELNLTGRVRLLGERPDAEPVIAALDVLTAPSQAEACPNVVGEAMACGVPCVVTDVGDMPRMVGNTGYVVPRGAPRALAAAWKCMISLGAEGRMALGNGARERVVKHFSLDYVVRQYESLYRTAALSVAGAGEESDVASTGAAAAPVRT
jgi:glycosyltransferase involved in cell wall biosynthesis